MSAYVQNVSRGKKRSQMLEQGKLRILKSVADGFRGIRIGILRGDRVFIEYFAHVFERIGGRRELEIYLAGLLFHGARQFYNRFAQLLGFARYSMHEAFGAELI